MLLKLWETRFPHEATVWKSHGPRTFRRKVTIVPRHDPIKIGTMKSIIEDVGIAVQEFITLLSTKIGVPHSFELANSVLIPESYFTVPPQEDCLRGSAET